MGIGEHVVTTFFFTHMQYSVFGGLDTPPFLAYLIFIYFGIFYIPFISSYLSSHTFPSHYM